ncbi:hypothetical protein FC62_GL000250 [Amylolactobacillus amylotrophicus DSM 20534]|uniref:Riboflavin transporter n=3 Tax=Amylolactobacillus TaxID=2767876 RepID=A0A0R1YKV1_9LACO|nr:MULTISPECIES: ECF transporter S component [Amylolactobacillus]APT19166.1 ECF transporter S component [Amylolactobacillus amylophilus DSM 20533 = JCM 1125]KRK38563.1 hypothetical protein FC62_GL000250 [Amylolactobacillus amylotrophicus DSM 20534]KRM42794.1 hypothetical protein FD40_GL000589 [Amylolactobacillus amylophilus DSM 20533 = JCM 1125]GED79657.1 riboflavin transporter [Amylolactobacillus amylophilus]
MLKNVNIKKNSRLSVQISWAMLGAMAFILMQFSFPIIPAFPYLKMDLSDVIVAVSAMIYGPLGATLIALIKATLDFLIKGANLMSLVGDVAAFAASVSFALPLYYLTKKNKTFFTKIAGLVAGTLMLTFVLSVLNYVIVTPLYISLAGFKLTTSLLNYILFTIIPFNLVKGLVLSIATFILMSSLVPILQRYLNRQK